MTTYVIRRLLQFLLILFGLSVVFFLIVHLTPGGPCAVEGVSNPRQLAALRICNSRLGLNQPLPVQYFKWISGYLHGNFGTDFSGHSVAGQIEFALPATLMLATVSYFFQQLIAIPLGVFSALRQYSFFDTIFTFGSYVGLSLPTFFLGLLLLFGLADDIHLFPAGRIVN